jgi:hypothetical protein
VDLGFVASLLAAKWFIPVWVGELPRSLLVDLWEAMLCEEDGTFLHLLLALHFVRLACDSLASKVRTTTEEPLLVDCTELFSVSNSSPTSGKPVMSTKRY